MFSVTVTARNFLDVLEEALEPPFEVEAVPQHEVGGLRAHDVERGRLIVVDLRAGLGDRLDDAAEPATFCAMSWMTVKVVTTRNGFFGAWATAAPPAAQSSATAPNSARLPQTTFNKQTSSARPHHPLPQHI